MYVFVNVNPDYTKFYWWCFFNACALVDVSHTAIRAFQMQID
jgi:hypothetical protein